MMIKNIINFKFKNKYVFIIYSIMEKSKEKKFIIRDFGSLKIYVTEWCVLGDCMQPECNHCYPVKDCKKHELCIKEGTCKLIPIK